MDKILSEKVEALHSLLEAGLVGMNRREFAASLRNQFRKYGKLSEKQAYWVGRLIDESLMEKPVEEKPVLEVGAMKGLVALLNTAKENGLKYPSLRLEVPGLGPLAIKRAGPNSKYAGSLMLTDGKPFGMNKWYGTVSPEGEYTPSKLANNDETLDVLVPLLTKLGEKPHRVASELGKLNGHCIFCNKKLTDEKSTAVGYGPVCATKWGLGEKWKTTYKKHSGGLL